jgi:hypothetical protein
MAKLALDKQMKIEVRARLISRETGQPIYGGAYVVRLFDKDLIDDDFLGQASPDINGAVSIAFNPSQIDKKDELKDKSLDFFFVLFKNGKQIFHSKVMEGVDLLAIEQFKMGEGEIIHLGTFLIDA